jgi:hypothetical protein
MLTYKNFLKAQKILLFSSSNKSVAIFGILIRDTIPNDKDLKTPAKTLAKIVQAPTNCQLQAIYLPHPISNLPFLISSEFLS